MADVTNGVFGLEYLEDAELEQTDVVGCASMLRRPIGPIVIDIPRFPDFPVPFPGPMGPRF